MSDRDAVRLFVRCKRCGSLFDTGRVVTRKTADDRDLTGTTHTCRHCATASRYTKNDYIPRATAGAGV